MEKQKTCKERVGSHLRDRITDIRKLWKMYQKDPDACDSDLGNFIEYGLSVDYVPKGTFSDQRRGYLRYQLSWGGPSDEFRYFLDETLEIDRVEYWFLDWFDGARKVLRGRDLELMTEIYRDWKELEIVQAEINKAIE